MGLTYAVPDLHGRHDLLRRAYDAICADACGEPGTIIHLGDYVDRGPESRQVVEFLMDAATCPPGWARVCLRGNHEDMLLMTIHFGMSPDWWIGNGGGTTLLSYGHASKGEFNPAVVPQTHLQWMLQLPRIHSDRHRVYVHAGVDPSKPLVEQSEERLARYHYPRDADIGFGEMHVVHGHTPEKKGPIVLWKRTNLDTGAYATGRLAVGVFDDATAGGPIRVLDVRDAFAIA